MSDQTMTKEAAGMFRAAAASYVKRINRQTRTSLADLYRGDLADRGRQILLGGPATKDELIRALMELHYPAERQNLAIHVLYHDEAGWTACEHCHPHGGAFCECSKGRQS